MFAPWISFRIWRIVSPLVGADNWEKRTRNFESLNSETIERIHSNYNSLTTMMMLTNPENFVKIAQGICLCVAFVFRNWVKFSVFGAPPLYRWGRNMTWSIEGRLLHAKFYLHRCNVSSLRVDKLQNRFLNMRYG